MNPRSLAAGVLSVAEGIELFFKALKQNLKIKTFVGTSANGSPAHRPSLFPSASSAVHIQIRSALIAILLRKFLQLRSRLAWSLSNLVALLRLNLFVHRDLWAWIDEPYAPPPDTPDTPIQPELAFA